MVKTYGLTHVALSVLDPRRAFAFYHAVLGMEAVYSERDFIQAQTPGARDVLVFERATARAGRAGGVAHFGFRLKKPEDISRALAAVEAAGGRIIDHGEFCPGEPYLFCKDPDGYVVEIWYELPTRLDPRATRSSVTRTSAGRLSTPSTRERSGR
jgi:catechol 2,3-dioxygenase-like lactoylglutathione lyase family enzyme